MWDCVEQGEQERHRTTIGDCWGLPPSRAHPGSATSGWLIPHFKVTNSASSPENGLKTQRLSFWKSPQAWANWGWGWESGRAGSPWFISTQSPNGGHVAHL